MTRVRPWNPNEKEPRLDNPHLILVQLPLEVDGSPRVVHCSNWKLVEWWLTRYKGSFVLDDRRYLHDGIIA